MSAAVQIFAYSKYMYTRLVTLTGALRAQPAIAPCGPAAPQVTASCSVRLCPVVCTISKPRAVRRRRRVRGYGVHNYRETASELCAYLWFYTRVQDPWIFVINCKQFSEVRAIRSTEQYYSTVVSPLLLACYISVYPYFGQFSSKKYRVQKFSYSGKAGLGGSGGVYTRYRIPNLVQLLTSTLRPIGTCTTYYNTQYYYSR